LCEVRIAPNSQEQPEQLADFLLHAVRELRGSIVFPTRDADILFLDRFRTDLEPFYRLAIPPRRVLFRVIDKAALAQVALEAGVPSPWTVTVHDRAEFCGKAASVIFPCVVKPINPVDWRRGDAWKTVGGRKALRANSLGELKRIYEQVSTVGSEILLQEWIPGRTDQIVVWGGYLGEGSEPLAYFTARKVVQSPDEFGTGCVVENEELPEMLEPSVRLCRALDYEGIAEIEYKRDVRDGMLKLIEVNARHWDWHQLSEASQVNLSWVAYCHLTGRAIPRLRSATKRAKWIAEDSFLTYALASLYEGARRPLEIRRTLSGPRMYSIFRWSDPIPFLRYSIGTLAPTIGATAIRKMRRRNQN
jgi:D-aspartate ligase